jgi:uncharacterized damage-inducible protein DinB
MNAYFATLARYNLWATRALYEHVDALSEADYRRDAGLFFKSVHGTLNHLLVGEHLLWWPRFSQGGSPTMALDAEAETDRTVLRQRLLDGAARWAPFIANLPVQAFDGRLTFTSTQGVTAAMPYAATLAHVFNHGTHHRGQITSAITAMGQPCPQLDLMWMLRAEESLPT